MSRPRSAAQRSGSLANSSTMETDETLIVQLAEVERRNSAHQRNHRVRDRAKGLDPALHKCRQLIGVDDAAAALLYIKCLSFVEETDRLLLVGNGMVAPSNASTVHKRVIESTHSTPSLSRDAKRVFPMPDLSAQPDIKISPPTEHYEYGGYYSSRFWGILCANTPKPKDGDVRDLWKTQIEFFLSCLGFIVGVGNTLRFPSMIYQYGGIFFVPYVIFLCIFGFPLVYMHLAIGQYSGLSASGAFWRMMPVASGIGWALVLLAIPVSIYYNIIVAWSLYYLWYSVQGAFLDEDGLPWSYCQEGWKEKYNCCELTPALVQSGNLTDCYSNSRALTAPEAFFHYQVLNRTFINDMSLGDIQVHLVVALAVAWFLVFFGVFKGIGSIGWAVSITATIPYLMLFVLLLRGMSLPGADVGIHYFLSPDFKQLWSLNIWRSAAEQVFYSLGIDAGPLISMASFSRYRNNIYRDALWLVILDTFTSFLCGMVIFSFVGFLATAQAKPINEILKHDSLYLSFAVYPGVTSFMDWGSLWAALFFGMLTLSALDAEFACKNKTMENRLLIGLCVFCFICGLPLCARGGIYIFHSIEYLNANWNSFSLSLMQVVVVCYIYGVTNFLDDIAEMLRIGDPPKTSEMPGKSRWFVFYKQLKYFFGPNGGYIKYTWCVFAPFILMTLLLASLFNYKRVQFNDRVLPWGYEAVAWIVMIGPLLVVPFTVFYTIYESYRRGRPISSAFSTANWRNKKTDADQIVHKRDAESEYMYIDPISRGASAKSRVNIVVVEDVNLTNEDSYSQANERVRQWAERSARDEPLVTADVPAIVAEEEDVARDAEGVELIEEEEETMDQSELVDDVTEDSYGRRPGRIRDLLLHVPSTSSPAASNTERRSTESNEYAVDEPDDEAEESRIRRPTVKRSPFGSRGRLVGVGAANNLNLFGPPPRPQKPENVFDLSASRIQKHRAQRRSDQRRNRIFNNSFNLMVLEPPPSAGSSGGNSADRTPSPAASAPDRPDIIGGPHPRLRTRRSSGSTTNASLTPFDIHADSTASASSTMPRYGMQLTAPRLKRPKPIGNIPQRPSVDSS